jgi:hypothetical protein
MAVRKFVDESFALAALEGAQGLAAGGHRQPAADRLGLPDAADMCARPRPGCLHDILEIGRIESIAADNRTNRGCEPRNQHFPRVRIAVARCRHEPAELTCLPAAVCAPSLSGRTGTRICAMAEVESALASQFAVDQRVHVHIASLASSGDGTDWIWASACTQSPSANSRSREDVLLSYSREVPKERQIAAARASSAGVVAAAGS